MQAQSRLSVSSGSSSVSADELEAVIRELTRGHELTAQLRAEAMRALRGQGQAEDTAAFILQEVSRAFAVCLSIMSSPARAPPPTEVLPETGRRPARDENVPRREIVTFDPNSDGYSWRKYGQKRITNASFPRCYFRCSYHRERGCPATKQVQQRRHGDPLQFVVIYVNEHTCDTPAWEAATSGPTSNINHPLLDLDLQVPQQQSGGLLGVQEEHERQALVLSLATVLGAHSPAASSSIAAAAFGQEQPAPHQPQGATASAVDPSASGGGGELPPRVNDVDADLDVMDFDVTGELYSYGLPDDGLPF